MYIQPHIVQYLEFFDELEGAGVGNDAIPPAGSKRPMCFAGVNFGDMPPFGRMFPPNQRDVAVLILYVMLGNSLALH